MCQSTRVARPPARRRASRARTTQKSQILRPYRCLRRDRLCEAIGTCFSARSCARAASVAGEAVRGSGSLPRVRERVAPGCGGRARRVVGGLRQSADVGGRPPASGQRPAASGHRRRRTAASHPLCPGCAAQARLVVSPVCHTRIPLRRPAGSRLRAVPTLPSLHLQRGALTRVHICTGKAAAPALLRGAPCGVSAPRGARGA